MTCNGMPVCELQREYYKTPHANFRHWVQEMNLGDTKGKAGPLQEDVWTYGKIFAGSVADSFFLPAEKWGSV